MISIAWLRGQAKTLRSTGVEPWTTHFPVTLAMELEHIADEVERLQERLELIADIAEGSTTANSLPHIAKLARGDDAK